MSFQCSLCDYTTTKEDSLRKHKDIKHSLIIQSQNLYHCDKCMKDYKTLGYFQKHLEKCKNTEVKNICSGCNRSFAHKNNLYRHKKQCMGVIQNNIHYTNLTNQTINSNNQTNQTNQTIQIFNFYGNSGINSFGNERTDYISKDFINQCIRRLGSSGEGIVQMTGKIHTSTEAPDNHNVRIPVQRCQTSKFLEVKDPTGWIIQDKDTVIGRMVQSVVDMLHEYYQSESGKVLKDLDESYYNQCFLRFCYTLPDQNYGMYRQIYAVIVNFCRQMRMQNNLRA
jgi:Zinc finger, C2H2 type